MTTIAELELELIGLLAGFQMSGGVIPIDIMREVVRLDVILPEFLDRKCAATCKNGNRCKYIKVEGRPTCRIHETDGVIRTGVFCTETGCRSFVKKYAPLCFTHAKRAGLVPEPVATGECSICYSDMNVVNDRTLKCNHVYHKKCIATWFGKNIEKTCPMCRAPS